MKVLKFGGGCLNSVQSIKRLPVILSQYKNDKIVIVVSAFQKTTNFLESLIPEIDSFQKNIIQIEENVSSLISYHSNILQSLMGKDFDLEDFYNELFSSFKPSLSNETSFVGYIKSIKVKDQKDYDFYYDQIVSLGEILSSKIINLFLSSNNLDNCFVDAREVVITNSNHRAGVVDWDKTRININKFFNYFPIITQGFIAGDIYKNTVTLGREGSDYSAAIIANILNAEEVILFKDVDGIYDCDPKKNNLAIKYDFLSYDDLSVVLDKGCSVVHRKTINPLSDNNIILKIQNFNNLQSKGTIIK